MAVTDSVEKAASGAGNALKAGGNALWKTFRVASPVLVGVMAVGFITADAAATGGATQVLLGGVTELTDGVQTVASYISPDSTTVVVDQAAQTVVAEQTTTQVAEAGTGGGDVITDDPGIFRPELQPQS